MAVRLLGVNGSFYLNAKKKRICRLVQNYTSLRASCVQVPCKFRSCAMQKHCTKMCSAFALHKPTEEFIDFILSASELHENVQRKSVAQFRATLLQVSS